MEEWKARWETEDGGRINCARGVPSDLEDEDSQNADELLGSQERVMTMVVVTAMVRKVTVLMVSGSV